MIIKSSTSAPKKKTTTGKLQYVYVHTTRPGNFLFSEKEVWNSQEKVQGEGTCIKSALIHGPCNLTCVQAQACASKKVNSTLLLEVTKSGDNPGQYTGCTLLAN